jgi:hypothetical protein
MERGFGAGVKWLGMICDGNGNDDRRRERGCGVGIADHRELLGALVSEFLRSCTSQYLEMARQSRDQIALWCPPCDRAC